MTKISNSSKDSMQYNRVLLKLSGELFSDDDSGGIGCSKLLISILQQIKDLIELGVKVGIVVGGGNIFRGNKGKSININKVTSDYIGMLATVINGLLLKDFLNNFGITAKVYSALSISNIVQQYNINEVLEDLEKNIITIFVAGTGNPFFTTDSGAALRAIEMEATLLIKATQVDGIYTEDPKLNKNAKRIYNITFEEAIHQSIKVMDTTAFDLCKAHNIDVLICNASQQNFLYDAISKKHGGTLVSCKI